MFYAFQFADGYDTMTGNGPTYRVAGHPLVFRTKSDRAAALASPSVYSHRVPHDWGLFVLPVTRKELRRWGHDIWKDDYNHSPIVEELLAETDLQFGQAFRD